MSIEQAADELRAALREIPNLKVYDALGDVVDPPAAIVGPPELTGDDFLGLFTAATFVVGVMVAANEHAMPRLYALAPLVAAAVHEHTDAVVRRATPGTWPAGGRLDLPAYLFEVESPL